MSRVFGSISVARMIKLTKYHDLNQLSGSLKNVQQKKPSFYERFKRGILFEF